MTSCSYHEPYAGKDYSFRQPQEAPIYRPTLEEFNEGPLQYIAKIRHEAEKYGICRIIPPESFKPTFAMDMDKFRFTPRIQRINELEATTRIRLNFMEQIHKFWALQGAPLKIPTVEKKSLDLFKLHKIVMEEGGFEAVVQMRRWQKVAARMGFSSNAFSRVQTSNALRKHYENLLYPYDVFQSGATVGGLESKLTALNSGDSDQKQEPLVVGIPRAGHHSTRAHSSRTTPPMVSPPLSPNSSSELKKLQTYGPGPRMPCASLPLNDDNTNVSLNGNNGLLTITSTASGDGCTPTKKVKRGAASEAECDIKPCVQCDLVKPYSSLLTCEDCDTNFHMGCLIPPLNTLPTGSWRCHRCLAQLVRTRPKPYASDFGFVQSQKHYSLQEFGDMADEFKSGYFRMPCNRVTTEMLEKEFWRLTQSLDETVTVEYGADLHTNDYGSGFPTATTKNLRPEDEKYITSPWNLNNLPILEGSVFKHINQNISGMIVPWAYVGMCFSTFCWHNEDHWTYSINYLHWGEPKSWYGVPGDAAEIFERSMKNVAPDLFESQPDLLHQLVTICNPNILMKDGVPIYRTDQGAGEFVVTFPRAYHTGFNQGFNLAEAVNFAPHDWIHIGRNCVNHYSQLHRYPVFSHDELVCKIAAEPDVVDVIIAESTHKDMLRMHDIERTLRDALCESGVKNTQRVIFELLTDEERLCSHCKTTCFLSALSCSCDTKRIVCVKDKDYVCKKCSPSELLFSYRYTVDEIRELCDRLKNRRDSFISWTDRVKRALDQDSFKENMSLESKRTTRLRSRSGQSIKSESDTDEELDTNNNKPSLAHLQSLILEANTLHYSRNSELYSELKAVISNAKKCSKVAKALLDQHERNLRIEKGREAARKARIKSSESLMSGITSSPTKKNTRGSGSYNNRSVISADQSHSAASKLTLEDLQLFHDEIANQPCTVPETARIKDMLNMCDQLLERFNKMISQGEYTFVDRSQCNEMNPQSQTSYSASDVEQLVRDMNYMTVVDFIRPINQLNYKLNELRWHEEADSILSRYTVLPALPHPLPNHTALIMNGARNSFFETVTSDNLKQLIDDGMNLPNMTRQIRSKLVQLQSIVEELTLWSEAMEQAEEERKAEEERQAELRRKAEIAERKALAQKKIEDAKRAEAERKAAIAAKKAKRKAEAERRAKAAAAAQEAELIAKAAQERATIEQASNEDAVDRDSPTHAKKAKKSKKSKKDDDEFLICVLGQNCKKPARIKGVADPVEWVGCDGCEKWFHQYCVGVSAADTLEGKSWFCEECVEKKNPTDQLDRGMSTSQQENKCDISDLPQQTEQQQMDVKPELEVKCLQSEKEEPMDTCEEIKLECDEPSQDVPPDDDDVEAMAACNTPHMQSCDLTAACEGSQSQKEEGSEQVGPSQ